jgi:hypothetical protein
MLEIYYFTAQNFARRIRLLKIKKIFIGCPVQKKV